MNKSKSEKNFKYHLIKDEDEENTLESSFISTNRELNNFKPFQLNKTTNKNYDTNDPSDNECLTKANKKFEIQNRQVINPLYDIDEYLHSEKINTNNNNSKCLKNFSKKMNTCSNDEKSHKRNSFLNILTRTIKDLVNKNQTHLDKNNFIDKKTFSFRPQKTTTTNNNDNKRKI